MCGCGADVGMGVVGHCALCVGVNVHKISESCTSHAELGIEALKQFQRLPSPRKDRPYFWCVSFCACLPVTFERVQKSDHRELLAIKYRLH